MGMLIDTMQCLQGQSFSKAKPDLSSEFNIYSDQLMKIVTFALDEDYGKAYETSVTVHHGQREVPEEVLQVGDPNTLIGHQR